MAFFSMALQAAPPDLTANGVIAGIDRSETYNLGPTGLRGWIYISTGNVGADGIITGESRQILVTVASTPGSAVLQVDDVILGAMAGSSGSVPLFTSDARKAFGAAIGDAEKTGAGTLRVKRWRAGVTTDENIPMTIMGDYTASAPYSCQKSSLILANARNNLVSQLIAPPPAPSVLSNDWAGAINGLALLAGVPEADPNYATVQTSLQTYARSRATAGPQAVGLPIWDWAYIGLFLAEYYLATGDANVLPGINSYTLKLAQSQSINGTFGHSPSVLRPDGSGRRVGIGYGPVNAVGIVANMALVMGKKALLAGGQTIDPEIDGAIQRGSDFFAFYVNKGPIPYGEHEPFISGHSSNGKDPMCSVLFGLQAGRAAETEYYSRMTIASYKGREYGHTGQGFSYLWSAMGANMGGALAVAEYLKPVRWHLDLSRRTDGSFAYDGAEQFGGGSTSDGTYLGASGYYGMNATASYILTYSLPLQRLYITGKRDNPAIPPPLTLDAPTVSHAVAAANFKVDCPGFTNAQLITSLSDFDPVVRHYAAVELGKRNSISASPVTAAEFTTLRNMVTGPNANGRMGACQALGLLNDTTALPTIVSRLDKTTETDLWVRAKAASAIRSYTAATASTHRDTMLTRFIANATNPDVIVWSDPIQMSNNYLSLALFGDAIYGGGNIRDYTINAPKNLLYPALQAGLKQPDSYSRSGASRFCFDKLLLTDVQAIIPDFYKVIEIECLADRMWSADSRANGIKTLWKHKVSEGIPYALNMLDIPAGFEWGSDTTIIAGLNALASYGDAARWTLPTLREYLGKWSPTSSTYTTLVSTIASIENAITAPLQVAGSAVATPQVVVTTGPKAITLTGTSPRTSVTFMNVSAPAHGTLTGTAPNLTYTPTGGYTGPDYFTFQTTDGLTTSEPGTVSIIVGTAGTGLKGEYFDNPDFTNLKLTRTDAQVNFDWGTGSPNAALGADTFSVCWSGLLLVPETGAYTFSTLNSDGARLYVNGVVVIDDYLDQTTNWKDGVSVNLTAGQLVDLQLRYYENTGSAVAKLKWTGPSFAGANGLPIATPWLFDGTGVTNRTAYAHAQSLTQIQNTSQAITLTGSGGTLTYTVLTLPAHGTLTGIAPNLIYTPTANYSGSDSFTFLVNNGTSNSAPATVSIGILAGPLETFTWLNAASGNWSAAGNWTSSAPVTTGQSYYNLNFAPSGSYTATHDLSNGFLLNQLNMAGTVTLAGTNSLTFAANGTQLPQFNQNSSNTVTVNMPINLSAMTSFGGSNGGSVLIDGLISGAGGLTKDNAGMLRIYAQPANSYSGGTVVNNGTLRLGAIINGISPLFTNPMGSGPVTLNGGTIEFERVTANNALTINGGTLYSNNGWGASWTGPITLNANATFNESWPLTCSGTISGSGGIIKTGNSTLTLSGTNNFSGPNKITAGTLTCTNAAALGTGSLDITTGAKVALNYTGTRTISSLTFNASAPLAPGIYGSTASTAPAANKNDTYFSGTGTVTVLPPTTTLLALTNGSSPANPGTSLTFTATVTGSSPTGNVSFYAGTTLIGTTALNGSFQASFSTSSLAIGTSNITAKYLGNATNASSTSNALPIEISSTLPSAPNNFLATPATNRIDLTWSLSTGANGYYVKRSLSNGGPYTVISYLSTGSYQDTSISNGTMYYYVISAINSAGESLDSAQANALIGTPTTTTTLTSSPLTTSSYGSSVTFTATISPSGAPATGTVTFRSGATVIGTTNIISDTATLTTDALATTNHSITATYNGDSTYGVSISAPYTYEVTPRSLTITGVTASNKIYDATTNATLSSGSLTGGVIDGENVIIVAGSGTFANANVGTWAITATGYSLGGTHVANYTLASQPTVANASITARPIQLTGTRAYDGTVNAGTLTVTNNLDAGNLSLSGSAFLTSKDVGQQSVITGTAPPIRVQSKPGSNGPSASTSINLTMNLSPAAGNTMVAVIATRGTNNNIVSSITQTGVPTGTWIRAVGAYNTNGMTTEIWYAPKLPVGAGTAIVINQASFLSAAVVMEYSGILAAVPVDQFASSTGNNKSPVTGSITTTTLANELWIGGIGFSDSNRNLTTIANSFSTFDNAASTNGTATNNAKVYALQRIVSAIGAASTGGSLNGGGNPQWAGAIATFKATTSSLSLSGSAASNYSLIGATGSVTITPKNLTVSGLSASNRNYNGTTVAALTGTAALLTAQAPGAGTTSDGKPYTGDTITLGGTASSTFVSKHIGIAKAVTVIGLTLSGTQSNNYSLIQPSSLTANITPLPITVSAVNATKTYDGTTTAAGTPSISPALASGDTTTTLSQAFQTSTAGISNKTIIPSITMNDGNSGANYAVTLTNFINGTINKASQTITFGPLSNVTTGTASFALSATASSGLTVSYQSSVPTVASISGNMATIGNSGTTMITASQAGDSNYLPATSVLQNLTVTTPSQNAYQQWLTAYPSLPNTSLTADPDGDGFNNLQEFSFGTNPTIGNDALSYIANGAITKPGPPLIANLAPSGAPQYHAIFCRRKNFISAGLTYTVQFSADLQTWTTSSTSPTILTSASNPAAVEAVSVPFPPTVPATGGPQTPTFFRITVSLP